jgi:zinc transporter
VEELDTARERAAITQEELNARIAEQMNTRMYALSVTAAIFLPLGLLTGLLGINVGGIPGSEHPAGFAAVCGLLLLVAILQISLYRKLRWL